MSSTAMTEPGDPSEQDRDPPAAASGPWPDAGAVDDGESRGDGTQPIEDMAGLFDQADIDRLLGMGGAGPAADRPGGIAALVNNPVASYQRLPMLEMVFEHLIRLMTSTLRNLTSVHVELTREQLSSVRLGDYLDRVSVPALIAVVKAVEWDHYGLVTFSSEFVYSLVELLLGGRSELNRRHVDGRPFTNVECALAKRLIHLVLHDMSTAFTQLSPIEFRLERIEINPRYAAISRMTNGAVAFRVRADMANLSGAFDIVLLHATLEPVHNLLAQSVLGEKFGRDSIWESHLSRQILESEIELEAVLEEWSLPLGELMELTAGATLKLKAGTDPLILVRCGHVPVLHGRMGQMQGRVALRVEEPPVPDTTRT